MPTSRKRRCGLGTPSSSACPRPWTPTTAASACRSSPTRWWLRSRRRCGQASTAEEPALRERTCRPFSGRARGASTSRPRRGVPYVGEGVQHRVVTTELDTLLTALYVHVDDRLKTLRWRGRPPQGPLGGRRRDRERGQTERRPASETVALLNKPLQAVAPAGRCVNAPYQEVSWCSVSSGEPVSRSGDAAPSPRCPARGGCYTTSRDDLPDATHRSFPPIVITTLSTEDGGDRDCDDAVVHFRWIG